MTSRRLWCRVLCQGSGKKVHSPASVPGPVSCSTAQTASTPHRRTFPTPASREALERGRDPGAPHLEREHVVLRPGRGEGDRRLPDAGPDLHDQRRRAPEPAGQVEADVVHRLLGDHPVGVVGLPGGLLAGGQPAAPPGVGQHLADPPPLGGEPVVRPGGPGRFAHRGARARSAAPSPAPTPNRSAPQASSIASRPVRPTPVAFTKAWTSPSCRRSATGTPASASRSA